MKSTRCTHPAGILTLLICMVMVPLHAQQQELELLLRELRKTTQQRDNAQKKLLETQSATQETVELFSRRERELRNRVETAERTMLELEASASLSRTAERRAREEVARKETEIEELTRQRAAQTAAYQALEQQLAAQPEPNGRIEEQKKSLEEDLGETDQRLQAAAEARQMAMQEFTSIRAMNQDLQAELNASRRSEALANAKLAAMSSRMESLQRELAQQYEERSELEQEKERLEREVGQLQTRLADLEATSVPRVEAEALREEVSMLRGEVSDLRQARQDEAERRQKAESRSEELDEQLAADRARLEESERLNKMLSKELRTENRRRRKLEDQVADLRGDLDRVKEAGLDPRDFREVESLLQAMEQENKNLKATTLNQRATVEKLMSEMDRQDAESRARINQLQVVLGEQLRALAESQNKIDKLEARSRRLDEVNLEKKVLLASRDEVKKDVRILADHIYKLRLSVRNQSRRAAAVKPLQAENAELVKKVERAETLNRVLKEENLRRDERVKQLRRDLEARDRKRLELLVERKQLLRELEALRKTDTPPSTNKPATASTLGE